MPFDVPPLRDMAVFHYQQAAEKALKGFLTWRDQPFQWTHDLLQLIGQCEQLDASFIQLHDAAMRLTPYASEFRYPADTEEPTPEDTAIAAQQAEAVMSFVRARLPREVHP